MRLGVLFAAVGLACSPKCLGIAAGQSVTFFDGPTRGFPAAVTYRYFCQQH